MRTFVASLLALVLFTNSLFIEKANALAPNTAVEFTISPELKAEQEARAEKTFKFANKQLVIESRFSSEINSPNNQSIPITVVQGQFGGTLTTQQRIAIGLEMIQAGAQILLFTDNRHHNEAAIFKAEFEKTHSEKILIVQIPDAQQQQLDRDIETSKRNVISRVATYANEAVTEAPQLLRNMVNITKTQFTPASAEDRKSARTWGLATVGMSMTVFFTFGVDVSFAIGASLLSGLTNYLLEYHKAKIENLSRVDIFRDFRVASRTSSLYQKLLVVTAGNSILSLNQQNLSLELTPEAIASNIANQRGQDSLEEIVSREITNNSANRIVSYVKIMNGLLGALAATGMTGFSVDMSFFEITQLQFYILGANITMAYMIHQFRKLERRIGVYDLRIVTTQAFRNYRQKVIQSVESLVAKYNQARTYRRQLAASEAQNSDRLSTESMQEISARNAMYCSTIFNY